MVSRAGRAALCVSVIAALVACPRPAGADPPDAEARAKALFYEGVAHLDRADVARALDAFQRSRTAFLSYQNAHNVVVCLKRLGRDAEALASYEEARERLGARLAPAERAEIDASIAQLEARLGAIVISSPAQGVVVVDDRARGALPLTAPLRVSPGTHTIRVTATGFTPFERVVTVPAGAVLVLDATLAPQPLPPRPKPTERRPLRGFFAEAFAGYAVGTPLGSDAERDAVLRCADACPGARGASTGIRLGHRFPSGFAAELSFGYLALDSSFRHEVRGSLPGSSAVTFRLADEVRLRGGTGAAGGSYVTPLLFPFLRLVARVSIGAFVLRADQPTPLALAATSAGSVAPFRVSAPGGTTSAALSIAPEIGLQASLRGLWLGVVLGASFAPLHGPPAGADRVLEVATKALCKQPKDAACAVGPVLPAGLAHRAFAVALPQVTIGVDL